ncbi:hypothetical protein CPT_Sansa33 [Caulobacter phage Sansa]|uniref:Uncharacterized protein n=1 Tax=Caulobacter phage Sansa TaxID=1675600 RepID=A0A0K1LLQ7_9CAUD|nr:hypothetical protein HOR07_gp033 [Caulobacter phage Sansa]AKU43437.1 hypothetical protein CPT_Sansa33 [Caulobacter phage Sansa]
MKKTTAAGDTPATEEVQVSAEEAARLADEQDREGAVLVPADNLASPIVAETLVDDEAVKNEWAKALVLAGGGERMPNRDGRKVIVVQVTGVDADKATYPKSGDAYLGYAGGEEPFSSEITAPVFLLGGNVRQKGFRGLSKISGYLCVGPSHPAFAAVNLAWQKGARDVKVVGLTDAEAAHLRPWFEEIRPFFDVLEYGG